MLSQIRADEAALNQVELPEEEDEKEDYSPSTVEGNPGQATLFGGEQ